MRVPLPNYDLLHELFKYNPASGHLRWRDPKPTQPKGPILRIRRKYYVVKVRQQLYFQHRIIWKMMTGADPHPDLEVDHIDDDRLNNRWNNLQLLTPDQNKRKKPRSYQVSPYSPNYPRKPVVNKTENGTWRARGWDKGLKRYVYLGTYPTEAQALAAK